MLLLWVHPLHSSFLGLMMASGAWRKNSWWRSRGFDDSLPELKFLRHLIPSRKVLTNQIFHLHADFTGTMWNSTFENFQSYWKHIDATPVNGNRLCRTNRAANRERQRKLRKKMELRSWGNFWILLWYQALKFSVRCPESISKTRNRPKVQQYYVYF